MLRKVENTNSLSDIYYPVSILEINYVEKLLRNKFPKGLVQLFKKPDLKLIEKLPTLLWPIEHESLGIFSVNKWLRNSHYQLYPNFLLAFATNECGDYWCINNKDNQIIYIEPELSIEENLTKSTLLFNSFDDWLDSRK